MVSALVSQDLDLPGEQDSGICAVAVDRRVRDANSRSDSDQPRGGPTTRVAAAATTAGGLAVSEDHHLRLGQTDIVAGGRRRVAGPRAQPAADAAAAGRGLGVLVLRVAETVEALVVVV